MTTIARTCLDRVLKEAAASPQREVCGLLLGTPDRIEAAQPTENVAPQPEHAFEIHPAALIAAYRAERAGGARVLGNYHSHPSGSAEPSARDAACAQPGSLWLIAAAESARLWRFAPEGFSELPLTIVPA